MKRFLVLAALILAGCQQSQIVTQIHSTHRLPDRGDGRNFVIVPVDPTMRDAPEFARFAEMVAEGLVQNGYTRFTAAQPQQRGRPAPRRNPDMIVALGYGIDGATIQVYPAQFALVGGGMAHYTGWARGSSGYVGHDPVGHGPDTFDVIDAAIRSGRYFRRELAVGIDDNRPAPRARPGQAAAPSGPLYQAQVISAGAIDDPAVIVPVMIRAMFQNFPGTSGETRTVVVATPTAR